MSNVKNCNPGKITVDLPWSNYFHELPLLSFGDIHGELNLSLVFNYQMKVEAQNPFFIKEGYKLNIHKMLMFNEDGIPVTLMEGNGKCVAIWGEDWPYGLDDNSQRFIRQTGLTSKPYVIENADYSKEYYNADGMIVSAVDKYGVEVLKYTYSTRYGWLTSVKYRSEKTIQFSYTNDRISKIAYGSTCVTNLSYPTAGVDIQHYAGEVFHLESDGMNFTATAATAGYATKLTKTSNFLLTVSDYISGQAVNNTTYEFWESVGGSSLHNSVDITNNEGVKTRCQYSGGRLAYSYEIADSDAQFIDDRFAGAVQINQTMDNPYNSGALGTLGRMDGVQMQFVPINTATEYSNPISDQWVYKINANTNPNAEGCYILTGWVKLKADGDNRIFVESIADGLTEDMVNHQYEYNPGYDMDEKWKFFAYAIYANDKYIKVHLPDSSRVESKDFRLRFQKMHVIDQSNGNKMAMMEYGLIPNTDLATFVPINECEFIYTYTNEDGGAEEENISANYTITFQDLLKHKTNKKKNVHSGEVYINGCEEAFVLGSSGSFVARHTNPETKAVTNYIVNSCYLAIKQHVANQMITTRIKDDDENYFLVYQMVNASDTEIGYKYFNEYMDVVEENADGVTNVYTRNNDLVTQTTTKNNSTSYTRKTTYDTNTDGDATIVTEDEFGNTVLYTLDSKWGAVKSVKRFDDTIMTNTYDDDMCAMTKRAFGNTSERSNTLAYSNGVIATLESGSLSYDFTYANGKPTAVSKNDTGVEEHVYTGNTKADSYYPTQSNSMYSTKATFDKYGRLLNIDGVLTNVYDIAPTFNSSTGNMSGIGNNGNALLATTTDEIRGETARYYYDLEKGQLEKKVVTDSANFASKVSTEEFGYDSINRMTTQTCTYDQPNNKKVSSAITYAKTATDSAADERVSVYNYTVKQASTTISTAKTQNTFDGFKRVTKKVYTIAGKAYTKTLTYNKTRINKETDTAGITNTYTYDAMGRIAKVVSGGKTTTYHYDEYGQLVREDNQGLDATFVYVYDNIGNLNSIKTYAYTLASTSTPSGSYTTTSFGYTADMLTTFGGATIVYNSLGCPTTYDGKSLTWTKGKLSRMFSGTVATGTSSYEFAYNAFGQRVSKVYSYLPGKSSALQIGQLTGCNKHYYYDHAGRLISETVSKTHYGADDTSESIVFLYDESGIIGMVRTVGSTTNTYYFHRNLLGDVVAIYDTSGNMVAKYLYDAWGNCTISSETTNTVVANANPIRYRGYYYDDDTGLYYCNARYYSPKWRRFISPDGTDYLDPQSVNGLNLYCYSGNNPVSAAFLASSMISHVSHGRDSMMNTFFVCGNSGGYAFTGFRSAIDKSNRCQNFISNASESKAQQYLRRYGVSFYKRALVFMTDLSPFDGSAFSFGIIVIDDDNKGLSPEKFAELLNHEYGHLRHMLGIGPVAYFLTTALPSLACAGICAADIPIISEFVDANYYNFPWERIADYFGGVNRGYSNGANTIGSLYWLYTFLCGALSTLIMEGIT